MIRSVLYLQPHAGRAQAVADLYRSAGVLDDATALDGCLGAELQVPLDDSGPLLVTALWRDQTAYQSWIDSPVRAAHGEELAVLLETDLDSESRGLLYEIVAKADA